MNSSEMLWTTMFGRNIFHNATSTARARATSCGTKAAKEKERVRAITPKNHSLSIHGFPSLMSQSTSRVPMMMAMAMGTNEDVLFCTGGRSKL